MKTTPLSLLVLCCTAACFPAGSIAGAAETVSADSSLARLYPNGQRAKDLIGRPLLSSSGEHLGKLENFVIDTESGRIIYGIGSTGGVLGLGDTHRAVPFTAIDYTGRGRDTLTVQTTLDDWKRAPVFDSAQLSALGDADRADYIFRYYHQNWQPLPESRTSAGIPGARLQLATSLFGHDIKSGSETVGEIEDLVVNVPAREAQIILEPEERFTGSHERFVIPFRSIAPGNGAADPLFTSLSRSDFQSAKSFNEDAWSASSDARVHRWTISRGE